MSDGDAALEHVGEQRVVAAVARELLERGDRRARGPGRAERLLEVLDRGVVVVIADARDLAEAEEQIRGVAALRREPERLLERRLALVPVAGALVDLRQPGERGDRAGLAREDLLEDLAGGVGVVELAFPDVGGAGERLDLGGAVAERGVQLGALLEQLDEIVPRSAGGEQALELVVRRARRR